MIHGDANVHAGGGMVDLAPASPRRPSLPLPLSPTTQYGCVSPQYLPHSLSPCLRVWRTPITSPHARTHAHAGAAECDARTRRPDAFSRGRGARAWGRLGLALQRRVRPRPPLRSPGRLPLATAVRPAGPGSDPHPGTGTGRFRLPAAGGHVRRPARGAPLLGLLPLVAALEPALEQAPVGQRTRTHVGPVQTAQGRCRTERKRG